MSDIERWIYAIIFLLVFAALIYVVNLIAQHPERRNTAPRRIRRLKWRVEDAKWGSGNAVSTTNRDQDDGTGSAVAGGAKTFRLARGFHTEECYRARSLTAEELVKRTFIGVDAATVKKLDKRGSFNHALDCEFWHWVFDDELGDTPSCHDIATAAERLGFFVEKVTARGEAHFKFVGVRVTDRDYNVVAQCAGCECGCVHIADQRGIGCDACQCLCEGCYCANGCADDHPEIDDSGDPLMSLVVEDANELYRSRRFKIAQRWHTDDCKLIRSFTSDEFVRLLIAPPLIPEPEIPWETTPAFDFKRFDFAFFEAPPSIANLVDAFLRQGEPVYRDHEGGFRSPRNHRRGTREHRRGVREAVWYPSWHSNRVLFDERWHCMDERCDCECSLCDERDEYDPLKRRLPEARSGCVDCDCQCEGCVCPGTCENGHVQPEVEPCDAAVRDRENRGVPSFVELSRGPGRRFELEAASWHASDCKYARLLTVEQLVDLTVHRSDIHQPDGRPGPFFSQVWCDFVLDCETWRNAIRNQLVVSCGPPTCREFADAAGKLGFQVERLPKKFWERQHYEIIDARLIVPDQPALIFWLPGFSQGDPVCYGCECFCPLCDDCSDCDCSCDGCYCANRCRTSTCAVACGPELGVSAVRLAHSRI